jgi:thymidine kinase
MSIKHPGKLEVICGSMFSGKSEELIRRLRRAEFARRTLQVFKHQLDDRSTTDHVHAHSGSKILAIPVYSVEELRRQINPTAHVIGIDEVQFFEISIVELILELINNHQRVIVAGLDLDFRMIPFGCIPALMAVADEVTKLKAVCLLCGDEARFTQRLVDGRPARVTDPLIMIGAQDCYQARCRSCYQLTP